MQLKELQIRHQQYYSDKPLTDKYEGKVSFFNMKGEAMTVVLREDQLQGILEICGNGLVAAAKEAAHSIVASVNPVLQIEQSRQRGEIGGE